jgi:ABC-type Fe3+ transport system permease subunit
MNDIGRDLLALARNIGPQLISLLTLLICLVIVLIRRKRHQKVSLIAALALVLIILHSLVFAIADVWLPRFFIEPGYAESDTFYAVLGLASSVTLAIAFGVLLSAIFKNRKAEAPGGANPGITWRVKTRRVGEKRV